MAKNMNYKVRYYRDGNYAVYAADENDEDYGYNNILHTGSLADCEAYIRLTKEGYMD